MVVVYNEAESYLVLVADVLAVWWRRATKAVAVSERLRGSNRSNGRGEQTVEDLCWRWSGGGSDSKGSMAMGQQQRHGRQLATSQLVMGYK